MVTIIENLHPWNIIVNACHAAAVVWNDISGQNVEAAYWERCVSCQLAEVGYTRNAVRAPNPADTTGCTPRMMVLLCSIGV